MDHFIQHPDVIAEYFYMISKALRLIPSPFAGSYTEASVIVQAATTALCLRHFEAQKCVLLCLERLIQVPSHPGLTESLQATARRLITESGGSIVHELMNQLSGQSRAYCIDEKDGCICDVMWCLRYFHRAQFQVFVVLSTFEIECFIAL